LLFGALDKIGATFAAQNRGREYADSHSETVTLMVCRFIRPTFRSSCFKQNALKLFLSRFFVGKKWVCGYYSSAAGLSYIVERFAQSVKPAFGQSTAAI